MRGSFEPTRMQREAFYATKAGLLQHEVAKMFGIGRAAVAMRLLRHRQKLGEPFVPRKRRKRPAAFLSLSHFTSDCV